MPNSIQSAVSEAERTIAELNVPSFEAYISPADIEDFSARDQKLILAFSVMNQQLKFLVNHALTSNKHMRKLEERVILMERWRNAISGPLGVVLWIVTAALPFVISKLLS
jgi:hypothetical protein